jgi:hypothetical protein
MHTSKICVGRDQRATPHDCVRQEADGRVAGIKAPSSYPRFSIEIAAHHFGEPGSAYLDRLACCIASTQDRIHEQYVAPVDVSRELGVHKVVQALSMPVTVEGGSNVSMRDHRKPG